MGVNEKACPRCAETIKAQAAVCRFCGHQFNPLDRFVANNRNPNSFQSCMGCVGVVFFAFLAFVLLGRCSAGLPVPAPSNSNVALTANEIDRQLTAQSSDPRFNPAAIEAMKKELLTWRQVKDLFHQDAPVDWTVGVYDDGSTQRGMAESICMTLSEKKLVDKDTDLRIVDVVKAQRSGDWRSASLNHINCSTYEDMGV